MLRLRQYTLAADFLQDTEASLLADEIDNNMILGVPLRARAKPELQQPNHLYLAVFAEERLVGAVAMLPPFAIIVHAQDAAEGDAAIRVMVEALVPHQAQIPGANGRLPAIDRFAQEWSEHTGCVARKAMAERVHALREVAWHAQVPGALRQANAGDVETVCQWYRDYLIEAMGEQNPDVRRRVQIALNEGRIYLWEIESDEGARPVSIAGISRIMPHGQTIGPVYTPTDLRGHGYASAATAALSALLLAQGSQYTALFTDLANPTSNKIYQRIGYQPVCDYAMWEFNKPNDSPNDKPYVKA